LETTMNLSVAPAHADAADQAARRWHAQLEVNGTLFDAGLLDEDGYHAAQRATWDAIEPGGRVVGREHPLSDAVITLIRRPDAKTATRGSQR
jgi:hypothetical protein